MKFIVLLLAITIIAATLLVMQNLKPPNNLGITNGKLSPLPSTPNAVSSQTEDKERYVEPLVFKTDSKTTRTALKAMLSSFKNVNIVTESDYYIHAVSISGKMRYRDDLEFFIDTNQNIVHFRSGSRVGYSDMGLNRERYNQIKQIYDTM